MRIVFDFELFPDSRINKNLLEILIALKAGVKNHLASFTNELENGGAIILIVKPSMISASVMGFEEKLQQKIILSLKTFDYESIIFSVANAEQN